MAEKNEIAKQQVGWGDAISEKLDLVSEGLPKEFNKTRFVQNAIALINGNETLTEWNKAHGGKQILAIDSNQIQHQHPHIPILRYALSHAGNIT